MPERYTVAVAVVVGDLWPATPFDSKRAPMHATAHVLDSAVGGIVVAMYRSEDEGKRNDSVADRRVVALSRAQAHADRLNAKDAA